MPAMSANDDEDEEENRRGGEKRGEMAVEKQRYLQVSCKYDLSLAHP